MITIRRDQGKALEAALIDSFESRILDHLRRHFPVHAAKLGETQARAVIRDGMRRSVVYGIVSERGVCTYIDLMVAFGEDFDRSPKYPWAREILYGLDLKSPATRIDRLHDRALSFLASPASRA
jgi:hypothetical protein